MTIASLDKNMKYVVAVSNGPDSMALLDLLFSNGYDVIVAHVNYHRRQASDLEQSGLEQYCLQRDIPIYVLDLKDVEPRGNFQAWARKIRYRFFAEIAGQTRADGLLVAHHRDDNIETILMQKERKTMPFYKGISPHTKIEGIDVWRPLLHYHKQELIDYCRNHEIDFSIDVSNLSDDYRRNQIRHHVLPSMSESEIEKIEKEAADYNNNSNRLKEEILLHIQSKALPIKYLETADSQTIFIALATLCEINFVFHPIGKGLIKEVATIVKREEPYWKRHLAGSYWIVRNYHLLEIIKLDAKYEYAYTFDRPTKIETPYFFMDFTNGSHRNLVNIDDYPITIRNPHPGDTIIINRQKRLLRRLFIDWKLPRHKRMVWPVIVGCDGTILFVPRYQSDYKIKKTDRFYVR